MNGSRFTARFVLLVGWCGSLCLGITSAGAEEDEWYSPSYQVIIGFHYTSECNPGTCEGEKVLDLMSTVENIAFGHSPTPDFGCWMYQEFSGAMVGKFGHAEGDAEILDVEMCPHLSGAGEEPNRIVGRNNDFEINLSILPRQAAEEFLRVTGDNDPDPLVLTPLLDRAWMHFQAMTPFSNPAVEWENSDGNGLVDRWAVIFNVPLWQLKKGENFEIEVPVEDECGKGKWVIGFVPLD